MQLIAHNSTSAWSRLPARWARAGAPRPRPGRRPAPAPRRARAPNVAPAARRRAAARAKRSARDRCLAADAVHVGAAPRLARHGRCPRPASPPRRRGRYVGPASGATRSSNPRVWGGPALARQRGGCGDPSGRRRARASAPGGGVGPVSIQRRPTRPAHRPVAPGRRVVHCRRGWDGASPPAHVRLSTPRGSS